MISRVTNQRSDKTAFRLTVPVVYIIAWMDARLFIMRILYYVGNKSVFFSILMGTLNHTQLHCGHIYCCLVKFHSRNQVNAIGICAITSFAWRRKSSPWTNTKTESCMVWKWIWKWTMHLFFACDISLMWPHL